VTRGTNARVVRTVESIVRSMRNVRRKAADWEYASPGARRHALTARR